MTDAIARGERAERELEFLDPAFETVVAAYLARIEELAASQPWESAKITALANCVRITRSVRAQIKNVIHEGELARSTADHVKEIEKLSPAKRRFLDMVPSII